MLDLNDKVDSVDELPAEEWNNQESEMLYVITETGQTPAASPPDPDQHQLGKAIANYVSRAVYGTESGSDGTAYILTPPGAFQKATAYWLGMIVVFKPNYSNTIGNPTVNYNSLGAKNIRRMEGGFLQPGDLQAGVYHRLIYQGTNFRLLDPRFHSQPRGYIDGFLHSRESAISVNVASGGRCMASDGTVMMYNEAEMTKEIDAAWSAGDDAGGYPSTLDLGAGAGVLMPNLWYRFFALWEDDDGEDVDYGWDSVANSDASALLADATDYNRYRQIGWHRTGGATTIRHYHQDPDNPNYILWDVPEADLTNQAATVGSRGVRTITAPPYCRADISVTMSASGATYQFVGLITAIAQTATTPAGGAHNISIARDDSDLSASATRLVVNVGANSTIGEEFDAAGVAIWLNTLGYYYNRGKA